MLRTTASHLHKYAADEALPAAAALDKPRAPFPPAACSCTTLMKELSRAATFTNEPQPKITHTRA